MPAILRRRVTPALVAALLSVPAVVSNRALDDWPQWRGPKRDGVSAERGLLKDWPPGGPKLAWKAAGAGEGYSSFATANGRLYTLGARGGTEYVIAYDAASGKRLWESAHGQRFSNDRGDGPRATPTIEGNTLYAFGASGDLSAMDATTGKVQWRVNVLKQFGGSNITWGLSESPLVLSDRILINAGAPGRVDRRAQEDRRFADLEEPGRRGGLLVGDGPGGRRRPAGDLLHRPARARRRRRDRQAAVELRQGRQQHRQHRHADRPRQPRVPVLRVRHRRGAPRDVAHRSGCVSEGDLLLARDAQPPRQLGAGRRLPVRLLRQRS